MAKASAVSGSTAGSAALAITVPGTLAIQSNAGQVPAFYSGPVKWTGFTIAVGDAPVGSPLVVNVGLATSPETVLFTLTIAAGDTSASATGAQIADAGAIPANTNVVVDVTAVGSTFPGANLTAMAW